MHAVKLKWACSWHFRWLSIDSLVIEVCSRVLISDTYFVPLTDWREPSARAPSEALSSLRYRLSDV